jgi:acyl-CoA hydrolase/RimJ/RimL family protein N-acetyltransferase
MQSVVSQFQNQIDWSEIIKSGDRIFLGSNAGIPNALIDSLIKDGKDIKDIEVTHIGTLSDERWALPEHHRQLKVNTFFIHGDVIRKAVDEGRADYTPCFLSEISSLFSNEILPLDAALIMVSPPDELGYCSLGVSVDVVMSAARSAKKIVAQINPQMPRTAGHSFLHISEFAACIEHEQVLPEIQPAAKSDIYERIGQYVAMLVEDNATLQLGIGKIPDATLRYLGKHKNLGIHSEMISDGVIDLIQKGVINNRSKTFHPGKSVVSFCMGTKRLYDFVHNNPHIEFYPSSYVNKPTNIAKNDNLVSVNSALEVDLTGQVVADSIGYDFYSGIGGQVDFVTGATLSKGGKPIIALPSTAKGGTVSRIVANINEGAGVVTSRGNVHYIVTEFGVASLKGKSIRERALELIRVAHPKFREGLLETVRQHYWVPDYQTKYPTDIPELGELQLQEVRIQGEVFYLRPLNPADERRLQEFFYSHTKETLRLRYNYVPQGMSRQNSCDLVSVDQTKDIALTIVNQQGSSVKIEAVGRYYLNADNTCEVAFVTRENQQGKGMASRLMKEMISIAKLRHLSKMVAYVRSENKPMINVFEQFGFKRVFNPDPAEVELVLFLEEH